MPRYRGDDIPPVSDYAHYNEEAQQMWWLENRYDMEHAGEPLDDPNEEYYDELGELVDWDDEDDYAEDDD